MGVDPAMDDAAGARAVSTKRNLCGVLIDAIEMGEAIDRVLEAARGPRGLAVSALAVHGVMTGVQDRQQRSRLNEMDLVVADGQPVRWALNLVHSADLRDRVYGPRLMLEVCSAAAREDLGIYLYGTRPDTLDRLERNLRRRIDGIRILGSTPSRFAPLDAEAQREIAHSVRESGASLCFVGLGCPRQEVFAWAMRDLIGMPLIAVGAAFDFHSGMHSESPDWMQRAGLQWLHRLVSDPRRLWRRYLLLNPAYILLVAAQRVGLWRPGPLAEPPGTPSGVTGVRLDPIPG